MSEEAPVRSSSSASFPVGLILLLIVAVGAIAYSVHERSVSKELATQNNAMTKTLDVTRDQLGALSAKVSAMEAKPTPESVRPSPVYRKPVSAASARHRMDDPRWKKMQGQLDDQGRQIDATRQDLSNTRTELQGSIAKNHDELVLLEKKGERNYYEFDLDKTGEFARRGPVSIRLRKANTKHEYADLELMVDDFKVSKKHVNVYEPVVFYPADEKTPVELVINTISKNHIHGYVSEPKYRSADLQAMANSQTANQGPNAGTGPNQSESPARPRLEVPKN